MAQDFGRFDRIFNACLESILSGQESLDSALAKQPRLAGELRPRLEAALVLVSSKAIFDPDLDFVPRSRQNLVSRIQREPRLASAGIVVWLAGLWRSLQGLRLSPRLTAAALALAVIMILITGGGTAALLAEGSVPGDVLYPVKNAIEDARIGLATDPADQASLHLEVARRRAAEIEILAQEQRWEPIQAVVTDYEWHLGEAVSQIKLVLTQDAIRARELAETLEQMMVSHRVLLASASQGMPELARRSVEHALSMNETLLLFAQDVLILVEAGEGLKTPTATPTPTGSPSGTSTASATGLTTGTPLATSLTSTPGTLLPGSVTPASLTGTPTPAATVGPSPTPPAVVVPTGEVEEPKPTKKPTKTPKPLPDPTRRPPHPTEKDK